MKEDDFTKENEKKLISLGYVKCECCLKLHKKIVLSKDGKKKLCKNCKKKEVTNKWYVPYEKRKENGIIGNYNFTSAEKNTLHRNFMNQGLSYEMAWKKVNTSERILRWSKRMNRINYYKNLKKQREQNMENKEMNKKFLEGLKVTTCY